MATAVQPRSGVAWTEIPAPRRTHWLALVAAYLRLVRRFPKARPWVAIRTLARSRHVSPCFRTLEYLERERPDIVFLNLGRAETAGLMAALLLETPAPPMVPVVHGGLASVERGIARTHAQATRKALFPGAAAVAAVSRGVAQDVAALGLARPDRVAVVYNPFCTAGIVEGARETPDHPWFSDGGLPVLLGAGRLVDQKDFATLIAAFGRVAARRPCRLVILGDGRLRGKLEALVRRLGLGECVSMPGWTDNPFAFMARAALFVLSSRYEGLGRVLVEALACGCPCVSTDCPWGPAEILEDPELLAPVGDPERLSEAMLRALARPPDKTALRAKAAKFSLENSIDAYERIVAGTADAP